MNAKSGIAVVALLLLWATVGGCPAPTEVTDAVTDPGDSTPADSDQDASAPADSGSDNASGSPDAGSSTSSDGSTSGTAGSSGSGSSSDGDSSGAGSGSGSTDGGDDPDDGDVASECAGSFSAGLPCTETFTTQLGTTDITETTRPVAIAFDADGLPIGLPVFGYSAGSLTPAYELVAEVNELGESVTLDYSSGTYSATLTVTVALVRYGSTSAQIVLNLDHEGQDGNRGEVGTGTQVIEYELSGGYLTYSSLTEYEVEWQFPSISVATTQEFDCQGTLTPE